MVQTAIILTSGGGLRMELAMWRKYSKFNSLFHGSNTFQNSYFFLNFYLLSLSLLTWYYHNTMELLIHFIFHNCSYFLCLEWCKYVHAREVPETLSTKKIAALGHQLPTYDCKLGVVLNTEIVYYPYPPITLAFDASRVFDLGNSEQYYLLEIRDQQSNH